MQILVLGMHRAGTSMVARVLNLLGLYFGPKGVEMPPHPSNPKGFWERKDVNELCIRLLRSADCEWYRLSGFAIDKIPFEMAAEFRERARQIIIELDAHPPWFVKEPRLCVLAPLWLELLETPMCIFVHRSPLEIAQSLQARNGFTRSFSLALWERYMTAALEASRQEKRVQVNHAELLADPVKTVHRLAQDLGKLGLTNLRLPPAEEIVQFIDPSLYRAKVTGEEDCAELTAAQKKLWDAFESGAALREGKSFGFSPEAQQVLLQHEPLVEMQATSASVEKRNLSLSTELLRAREELKRREEEAAKQARQLQVELQQHKAEIANLRLEQEKAVIKTAVVTELQTRIDELTRINRILSKGLGKIESAFGKLRKSRSFHHLAYTARKLGLVSRTPRRCVEAIQDQFSAIHKTIEEAKNTHVPERADAPSSNAAASTPPTPQGASVIKVVGALKSPAMPSGVAPRTPIPPSRKTPGELQREQRIAEAGVLRIAASARNAILLPEPSIQDRENSVCFILLHRGGEAHLTDLFSSFVRVNTLPTAEFRIALHGCTDNSREVIKSFASQLDIKVTEYERNYSFSYSNNRAAEQTSARYLVFLNNDIVFTEDVVPHLLRVLRDPRNGIAGVRLLFPADEPKHPNRLQHGGVKFELDSLNFFHRPRNVGVHICNFDTPPVPEKFPAVTAALAACRREQFLKIGGFCEDYFYGYEDVDLCLSLQRLLGLRSVCANDVTAIHHESATGQLYSPDALARRRANNIRHFIRRHGWYLRRQFSFDKVAGNLFFSDLPLTVAFAAEGNTTATPDYLASSQLGEACVEEFGWKIRYLSPNDDWYNLKGIDVLVVVSDSYDLSKAHNANPNWIAVAWVGDCFEQWVRRPGFSRYDLFLSSSLDIAQSLRQSHQKLAWIFPLATNPADDNQANLALHRCRNRARAFKKILLTRARRYRIAIKIAAPRAGQNKHRRDHEFAYALGRCLAEQGHSFRVDYIEEWESPEAFGDDVVVVVRGAMRYQPKPGQINLMLDLNSSSISWNDEYEGFDHIFTGTRADGADTSRGPGVRVSRLSEGEQPAGCAAEIDRLLRRLDRLRRSRAALMRERAVVTMNDRAL